jgi:hypothetical protein
LPLEKRVGVASVSGKASTVYLVLLAWKSPKAVRTKPEAMMIRGSNLVARIPAIVIMKTSAMALVLAVAVSGTSAVSHAQDSPALTAELKKDEAELKTFTLHHLFSSSTPAE